MVKIVCLIATWRDGSLLAKACASAAPHVDKVIVLDGGYKGIVQEHQAWSTDEEMLAAHGVDPKVYIAQLEGLWPDEVEKRNALCDLGRLTAEAEEGEPIWALVLDADEELVNGEELAYWIERVEAERRAGLRVDQAIGLQRIEPDGDSYWAPSRLFHLTASTRYAGPAHVLTSDEYGKVSLASYRYPDDPGRMPYVLHHWNERPEWRLVARLKHGALLARQDAAYESEEDGPAAA
jgi:hypothetical protein